jgi:hypothetical protein
MWVYGYMGIGGEGCMGMGAIAVNCGQLRTTTVQFCFPSWPLCLQTKVCRHNGQLGQQLGHEVARSCPKLPEVARRTAQVPAMVPELLAKMLLQAIILAWAVSCVAQSCPKLPEVARSCSQNCLQNHFCEHLWKLLAELPNPKQLLAKTFLRAFLEPRRAPAQFWGIRVQGCRGIGLYGYMGIWV